MAALEGEAMLLGHWKNIEELEDSLCLEELELIVKSMRDQERRQQKFFAALKGIDIDDDGEGETGEDVLERAKRKAQAKLSGLSEEEVEQQIEREELEEFGFEVEKD